MTQVITALYENGALRPLTPLNLRERQRVQVQILPTPPETDSNAVEAVIQRLIARGLVRPRPIGPVPPPPMSNKELKRLAGRLGKAPGKPASEMVIEDRGNW
ncbi:MAG TPA: antitoxin family protein [Anaerolineae bacterium]|nr:antitoxin family protein [Anaerolineae bacterium]HQI84693.1 antitoxin family protein [Anaerolineae bacterium]